MTTTTMNDIALPAAVDQFLRRIETGDWDGMEEHVTADVRYDASVPGWHYQYQGAGPVLRDYREEWSGKYRWTVVQRHALATDATVVLDIEMHGRPPEDAETPVPAAVCRLANIFRLEDGRIAEHRYYCCGEWDPETVRHIAEHAPMIDGRTS